MQVTDELDDFNQEMLDYWDQCEPFMKFMHEKHNLILTYSEMVEILIEAKKLIQKNPEICR